MASFSCLWICHWFIMISFGSIVLLLYYWILLVDCGQWLRRLICSSVFCYGYITGSWWTMLGCCYADTQGCSWGHHLCKTHELPNILRWGNMFSITRGLEVYCWLFFLEAKKPWWLYFHELDIFQPVAILIYLLVVELHKPKIHGAQKELPFLGNRFRETTESLEDHRT